jgi:16S rRNA C967 or C1407 C5-methylase (RsmB/RsmF family)
VRAYHTLRDSVCEELRVALDALVLVQRGYSERAAAMIALGQSEYSQKSLRKALSLVSATLERQDELNELVIREIPEDKTLPEQCLASLAALIVSGADGNPDSKVVSCLRQLAPNDFRRDFEYLLGALQGSESHLRSRLERDEDQVAAKTHNPLWWVKYCFHTFGRARARRLLSDPQRPRYLRVNPLRNNGSLALPTDVRGYGDSLTPISVLPGVYRVVSSPASLSRLVTTGVVQFQDLASYCAVLAATPVSGDTTLDMCAAPGAKTSALAQLMKNSGEIVSVDYSSSRMNSWKNEMGRLGVEIAHPIVADATELGLVDEYDLVLLDPPCSGTGILDRNPRMKWNLNQESIRRYSQLQVRMLEEAYRLMAPNGRIVYSTCSVTLEENEHVISTFLKRHPDMETRPLSLSRDLGSEGMSGITNCRRFYTYLDKTAGYFIARLERI